jgi:uncharacterized membrane protein YfcA
MECIACSTAVVVGNFTAQIYINWNLRHPRQYSRQMIYWDAVYVLSPASICGANIGVIISSILSDSCIYITALFVLFIAVSVNLSKVRATWATEEDRFLWGEAAGRPILELQLEREGCLENDEFSDILHVPYPILRYIVLFWVFYICYYMLIQDYSICSPAYFILTFCLVAGVAIYISWALHSVTIQQNRAGWLTVDGDIDWQDQPKTLLFSVFIVGMLAGLIGIGGGELLVPYWLSYGMLPQVAMATSPAVSILSTSSSLVYHIAHGQLNWLRGVWMISLGLSGGYSGKRFGVWVTDVSGRSSYPIIVLTGVTFCSCALFLYKLILDDFSIYLKYDCGEE